MALIAATGQGATDELARAAHDLRARYAEQLDQLAAWCDKQGLAAQAKITRQWLGKRDPNKLYVADLPHKIGRPELPADSSEEVVQWDQRFWQMRRQQAKALEALARRAVRADRASLAFDLVMAGIHEDPDHEGIRRILGFQKFRGQWHTLYEVDKLKSGQVWDEKFGWLPAKALARYRQDERWSPRGWISAKEDAQLHADIANGWDVETEHYAIRTNHSLEAGVQLGVKLEQLHRVWRQLFIRYFLSEAQVAELFDRRNRGPPVQLPRLEVVYFRNREDYIRGLLSAFSDVTKEQAESSLGVYIGKARRAYYFAAESEDVERTTYHEATHQLFHQSRPVAPDVGYRANFWIVEGIATYMESLRREEGYLVLGGFNDERMLAARYRLLHDNFYVPFSELASYGMDRLQADPRIRTLYSQAAGMTHFLMHYDEGRYRDALVAYLVAVYTGRDNPFVLPQLTHSTFADLDKQYRQFIASGGPVVARPSGQTAGK